MRLNIEIIFEKIRQPDSKLYLKKETKQQNLFPLSGVRLWQHGPTNLRTDILYLCNYTDYCSQKKMLPEDCSLLITGRLGTDPVLPDTGSFILHNSSEEPLTLLEKIQSIFDTYTEWMEAINSALLGNQSLQDLFNLSAKFLKNPLAMFDSAQTLIMTTGTFGDKSPDSVWQEAFKLGYALKGTDTNYLENKLANDSMPFFYNSSDSHSKIRRLIAPLRVNHTRIGILGMTELQAPIDRVEYYNVHLVQIIMERAFTLKQQNNFFTSDTPKYLFQLLQGECPPLDLVSYQLSLFGQSVNSPFTLWVLISLDSSDSAHSVFKHYQSIQRLFPEDLLFFYENRLLVCSFHTDLSKSEVFLSNLSTRLGYLGLLAVYSMDFYNFTHLHHAYQQCAITLLRQDLIVGKIYPASESLIDYIKRNLEQLPMASGLLHPGTILLTEQNPDYGIQLLKTLQAYCMCGGNISAAAKVLFIHRHTMLYRMECISKIAHIDFNSLKAIDYLYINISCMLLLKQ